MLFFLFCESCESATSSPSFFVFVVSCTSFALDVNLQDEQLQKSWPNSFLLHQLPKAFISQTIWRSAVTHHTTLAEPLSCSLKQWFPYLEYCSPAIPLESAPQRTFFPPSAKSDAPCCLTPSPSAYSCPREAVKHPPWVPLEHQHYYYSILSTRCYHLNVHCVVDII